MAESLENLLARVPDPYGNEGVLSGVQWSSKWSAWSEVRRNQHLATVLTQKRLSKGQIIDILQELPPRPSDWEEDWTCLDEYQPDVARFRFDVEAKVAPSSLTWEELRAWCLSRGVPVPELVRQMVGSDEASMGVEGQTGAAKFEPWIVRIESKVGQLCKRRGRPPSTKVRDQELRACPKFCA
jgi:hypothetical protein